MNIDMSKIYSRILKIIYHISTALTSWSWHKLYGDRKKGYGYKKEKFNKLQQEQRDLDASYRQSLKNKKEREQTFHEMAMEGYEMEQKMYTCTEEEKDSFKISYKIEDDCLFINYDKDNME
jgi:hypothetical protein